MARIRLLVVAALLAYGAVAPASAQSPLVFPTEAVPFARPENLRQTMFFRPSQGDGPFPAVVLLHTCGGMGNHIYLWGERLVEAGYVALLVDSNSPRKVVNNCQGTAAQVSQHDYATDAAAGLAHLRRLPFVDGARLGVVGFSWGAMAALRLSGESYQKRFGEQVKGLRAIAVFYPGCGSDSNRIDVVQSNNTVPGDLATPTLMLLGAIDSETPPRFCTREADALKRRGRPIDYVVYPDTTHSFDEPRWGLEGRTMNHGVRGSFLYRHSPQATEDAWTRVRAFFEQQVRGAS